MGRLQGKRILITGGNSGIGLASARACVREGARLLITGRNPESLERAADELDGEVATVQADVGRLADIEALMAAARERFGQLDGLFVNAGFAQPMPLAAATEEHFDSQSAVTFKGAFFTAQLALPLLQAGSSVVFNTSCLDVMGKPGMGIYAATKAAVRSLVRTLGAELAGSGVRVNSVAPGPVETPAYDRMGAGPEEKQQMQAQIAQQVPMGRFGNSEEIAEPVVFLLSDESSYMTASELTVDGGMSQV